GEFADVDPHIAAAHISDLPSDELVYPPNVPDRKLYAGYWQAGRGAGTGQEGRLIRQLAEAYDWTCCDGAYGDAERTTIERGLLLEGTYLLSADPAINNKSIGNRATAALIGACVGHPALVRFGLDGFQRATQQWFLPDGGSPESPSYGMMALGGLTDLALAFRDYSDPPGYADARGQRLDHINLYRDPAYARAWEAIVDGLQGDLKFVP